MLVCGCVSFWKRWQIWRRNETKKKNTILCFEHEWGNIWKMEKKNIQKTCGTAIPFRPCVLSFSFGIETVTFFEIIRQWAKQHLEAVELALHRAHIDDELPRVRVALHERFETRVDNGRSHRVDRKHLVDNRQKVVEDFEHRMHRENANFKYKKKILNVESEKTCSASSTIPKELGTWLHGYSTTITDIIYSGKKQWPYET